MKQIIIFVVVFLIASCKNAKPVLKTGERHVAAMYKYKGQPRVGIVKQITRDYIKTDSASGSKSIVSEVLYFTYDEQKVIDTVKRTPIIAVNGRDSIFKAWYLLNKDSVSIDIENKDIDSLLKIWNR
jgi:hypothetical protein